MYAVHEMQVQQRAPAAPGVPTFQTQALTKGIQSPLLGHPQGSAALSKPLWVSFPAVTAPLLPFPYVLYPTPILYPEN